ncbi:acyltransferase family protein [Streptomyces sp. NPDC048182]|uniref:acyltransferase family protein n=1 Tax=Streptomyces sp. NPDC048182 TaxID=3365507 RepID=UPI0037246842
MTQTQSGDTAGAGAPGPSPDAQAEAVAPSVPASRASPSSVEGRAPGSTSRGHGRLPALDGLRFLAALAVVCFHFVGQAPHTMAWIWGRPYQEVFPQAHGYFAFGRLGVELFFLISGFVICMSAWGRSPRDFFVSRVTRLYPMYWAAIAVSTAVLYTVDTPFGRPDPRILFANLTMLQKPLGVDDLDSVYWTLWPELCFYLTFAVVVWKGLTYQRVVIFCGLWTVAAALAPGADIPLLTLMTNPTSAPYFIAGMAFYLMHRYRPTPLLWGIVAMSWLLALHFLLTPDGGRVDWSEWSPWRGWLVLVITVFFALIAAIALGWTHRIRWRGLTVAGTLTFPLYLLHDIVGVSVVHRLSGRADPWVVVGATAGALVLLAYLVQRFVERPVARAARRWLSSAEFSLRTPLPKRR